MPSFPGCWIVTGNMGKAPGPVFCLYRRGTVTENGRHHFLSEALFSWTALSFLENLFSGSWFSAHAPNTGAPWNSFPVSCSFFSPAVSSITFVIPFAMTFFSESCSDISLEQQIQPVCACVHVCVRHEGFNIGRPTC